jgi:hypothetical protein
MTAPKQHGSRPRSEYVDTTSLRRARLFSPFHVMIIRSGTSWAVQRRADALTLGSEEGPVT